MQFFDFPHTNPPRLPSSVEGSTIIIASCIPILQPLVKVIFDRNALSNVRNKASYSYDSHQQNHARPTHDSDIALSGDLVKNSKARSRAKIGISYPTEIDSQDSILREAEQPGEDLGHSQSPPGRQSGIHGHTKIKRVDEVTVSSSTADDMAKRGSVERW